MKQYFNKLFQLNRSSNFRLKGVPQSESTFSKMFDRLLAHHRLVLTSLGSKITADAYLHVPAFWFLAH